MTNNTRDQESPKTVLALFKNDNFRKQVSLALPKGIDPKRFFRIALTEVKKNKNFEYCNPESFASALLSAAQAGLEIGPVFGQCYLVSFKSQCQLILGYRGMIELACRSGVCRKFQTDVVREGDYFEYQQGTESFLKHRPIHCLPLQSDPNIYRNKPIICAYACATLADGTYKFEVIDMNYIDKIKRMTLNKSMKTWVTDEIEMIKKTAIRYLFKTLQLSPNLSEIIYSDDIYTYGDLQNQTKANEVLKKGKFSSIDKDIDLTVYHQEEIDEVIDEIRVIDDVNDEVDII